MTAAQRAAAALAPQAAFTSSACYMPPVCLAAAWHDYSSSSTVVFIGSDGVLKTRSRTNVAIA